MLGTQFKAGKAGTDIKRKERGVQRIIFRIYKDAVRVIILDTDLSPDTAIGPAQSPLIGMYVNQGLLKKIVCESIPRFAGGCFGE